jgi:aldehyde:ferredoxin oxidoreductase
MNPLLMLDLDTAQSSLMPVDERAQQAFIGGRGLGVSILFEHTVPDPLDPASLLCMLVGPLNGTMIPLANRLCFVFRSPQTGTIAWAHTGGYIAASLGAAGLSGLVLRGRAPAPIFLEVSRTGVAQHDAAELAGLGAIETTDRLRARYPDTRILAIGPAGEALAPIATVINDKGRASGVRHGLGAVLGSKQVKAIVVCGGRAPGATAEAKQLRPLIAGCTPSSAARRCSAPRLGRWRCTGLPSPSRRSARPRGCRRGTIATPSCRVTANSAGCA